MFSIFTIKLWKLLCGSNSCTGLVFNVLVPSSGTRAPKNILTFSFRRSDLDPVSTETKVRVFNQIFLLFLIIVRMLTNYINANHSTFYCVSNVFWSSFSQKCLYPALFSMGQPTVMMKHLDNKLKVWSIFSDFVSLVSWSNFLQSHSIILLCYIRGQSYNIFHF